MSHIFLSYAREDRHTAQQLAAALEADQLDVWWDPELVAGEQFRERLETQLQTAHAVIVLWSPHSIRSVFVRDEAGRALARNALVPLVIGGLSAEQLPLGFGELHAQDLSGWNGRRDDERYARFLAALHKKIGSASGGSTDVPASALLQRRAADVSAADATATQQGWTKQRSLLLLCLVLSLTVVALWLIAYSTHYAAVATVVAGVWTAVLAGLGAFKIRARETTLSEFLGLPPVKATIVTYTLLILSAIPLFALWELPVHRVQISAPRQGDTIPLRLVVLRHGDTVHQHLGALQPEWRFYARRGDYIMNALPRDHETQSRTLQVGWFTFSRRLVLDEYQRMLARRDSARDATTNVPDSTKAPPNHEERGSEERTGQLVVHTTPANLSIFLGGRDSGRRTPATLQLPPGSYTLELRGRVAGADEFGFYRSRDVQIRAGRPTRIEDSLTVLRLPTLFILPRDPAPGASWYLDTADDAGLLGPIAGTARTFTVFPGERLLLKKVGDAVTRCERVTLVAARQAQITC